MNFKLLKRIINKIKRLSGIGNIVSNVNHTKFSRNCLLVYLKAPFEERDDYSHQNISQIQIIARVIGELGYNVDVIDYNATKVNFNKQYDAVFDICVRDFPVYRNNLGGGVKRIAYFTGSESEFANRAELERIRDVEARRGVKLKPRRQAPLISKEVEKFDEVILIGNEYNLSSYDSFNLPQTYLVPNTGYDFQNRIDFSKKKSTSFLYFGSSGCVHKGLDLLLEIFAEKDFPCTLYVCGRFQDEKDFNKEYKRELYNTFNIKPIGFINIWSEKFFEICSECVFTVLPSCSEARAGTIATCLSAGLIPICSRECGYEEDEVIILQNCKKETIREAILEASNYTEEQIRDRSKKSIELIQKKYCMDAYIEAIREALAAAL